MWEASIIDTRKMGELSFLLDGFVHIVPRTATHKHWLAIDCWCDPRVTWPDGGDTCIVSHRHLRPPKFGAMV